MKFRKILSFFLMILAVLCLAAMIWLGKDLFTKNQKIESANLTSAPDASDKTENGNISEENVQLEQVIETEEEQQDDSAASGEYPDTVQAGEMVFPGGYDPVFSDNRVTPDENEVLSTNFILIDLTTNTVIAEKGSSERISPASMTKIMTVLVAAEHIPDLDAAFTVTSDMTDYCYQNGCSAAGFVAGETVPVRDLFYGTILPSGGEAAAALAICTAGSMEAFAELMNQKLAELGLSDTAHFTNCVGIYDENHYCTVSDMAMILKAAVENDWCREVLSTHVYTTSATEQNPEGLILSNWFLRRIEDKDCGGQVLCAKTGYVEQSGDCAASYEISASGKPYICVTVNTYSSWRCIYDHVAMYRLYAQ